ncbi:MAG: CDP-diacylglycerol--glycerol-3-phosphate 3-phosphatidyltransferase [Firmicutes bacterium]|nr:CDP-diacylglycerol--glycerol-3-phosphate 3-phosphatidyltransferase [Bacillota bacterium]
MNLANWITMIRIFLVPIFMLIVLSDLPYSGLIAAAVFGLAAATDGLDGYIARSRKQITTFGKLIDPIADKLLISAALVCLIQLGQINAWIAFIIIGREFAVSGLRNVAAAEGVVIAASKWGKLKTVLQIIAIVSLLLNLPGGIYLMWLSVLVTIASGVDYFLNAQELLRKSL